MVLYHLYTAFNEIDSGVAGEMVVVYLFFFYVYV